MLSWDEIWELHKQEPQQQDLLVRAAILSYECGKLSKAYYKLCGCPVDEHSSYLAEMKMELADIVCQLRLLCYVQNWSFDKLYFEVQCTCVDGSVTDKINTLINFAAQVLQKAVYTKLSGHDKHINDAESYVREMIGLTQDIIQMIDLPFNLVSDLGKTRIKNAKIQLAFQEEQQCH